MRSGLDRRIAAILAVLALAAVFVATSPDARFEADDAFDYASAVERAQYKDLLNPYHPIYLPIAKAVDSTLDTFIEVRSLDVLVVLGSMFTTGALVLFYKALKKWFGASPAQALFGAASLGTTYFVWRYAGEAEIYAFATFAGALLLWACVSWKPSRWTFIGLAALMVLAVLSHSVNAALVLATPLILNRRGWTWAQMAAVGGIAAALLLPALVIIYEIARTSNFGPASEASLIGFYLGDGIETTPNLRDLVLAIGVLGSVFVASNALFVFEPTRSRLDSMFGANSIADEIVMGATTPTWIGVAGLIAMILAGAAVAALLWRLIRAGTNEQEPKVSLAPAIVWCVAYAVVVLRGGVVSQPEVWALFPLALWSLVVGITVRRGVTSWQLAGVPATLLLATVIAGLLPLYTGADRMAETSEWLIAETREGDLVLTADSAGLARYLAYESPAHAAHIGYQGRDEVGAEMIEHMSSLLAENAPALAFVEYLASSGSIDGYHPVGDQPGRLFITADVFDPPDWLRSAKPLATQALIEMGQEHGDLFRPVDDDPNTLIRISDMDR